MGESSDRTAAAAGESEASRLAIDAERLRLLCRQTVRAPLGVVLAAVFIGTMMAPRVGAGVAWGWAGAAIGLWSLRAGVAAMLLAHPPAGADIARWIRVFVIAATASGAVAGSAAYFFFRAPPLEWALMTMVLCAWAAGGVAVSGAVPAAFYGLVTLFLAPLAVGWVASDMPLRWPVTGLLLFFLFYLIVYARDGAELVARALRVGFENEQLARELQRSESEARAARARAEDANLAKSRFLAAASHDLRQPLHSLALLLDHAVHTAREPRLTQTLQQAARSADSLHELFTGLLDLSRLDAGSVTPDKRPLSLGRLLERIGNDYRALAEGKGLRFDCAGSTAWALSDAVMLDRILRNLLDNAVKYTEAGRIAVELIESANNLRITVRDTGIGIDAADRERIFEEYFQARNPARDRSHGIGLGLAIVRRLATLLGVSVDVESSPGRGSAFTLTLPRCEPPPGGASDRLDDAVATPDVLRGMVVVLIEDDAEVIGAMRTLLADWGCQVVVAGDGGEAIAQLGIQGIEPHAVLADWRLAGTENGLQAIERLRARHGDRPAAIVSAEIDPADIPRGDLESIDWLRKPLRAADLRRWLTDARARH
jgi:signal transduction histidine kinase